MIPKLKLVGNESLLDIGCGDGKVSAMLASYLPHGQVVGIDSSEEMITLARQSFPRSRYPNLSFLRMDGRELTFCEQFDVAFSNATLHWIIDHQPVLAGAKKKPSNSRKIAVSDGWKRQRPRNDRRP